MDLSNTYGTIILNSHLLNTDIKLPYKDNIDMEDGRIYQIPIKSDQKNSPSFEYVIENRHKHVDMTHVKKLGIKKEIAEIIKNQEKQ